MQLTEQETIRRNEQQPLKERLQKARKRFDESNERLREVQTELNNSADADTRAMAEVNEIAEQLKTNKNNMRVLHSDMQAIKGEIETHRHSIAQCDADIASAEARNTEENADTLCRLSETLEEQRAAEVEARQAWQAAKQRLPGILAEESALGTEKSNLQGEINRARDTVADLQSKVARAGNGGGNSPWNRFPPGTQRAYEQIQREQWHGETPVGPLGQHVKLTDMRWQGLLEAVLGGTLNSFIATDKRDRSKLQDILQRSGVYVLGGLCKSELTQGQRVPHDQYDAAGPKLRLQLGRA
jgi:chromosome segregation ATPase